MRGNYQSLLLLGYDEPRPALAATSSEAASNFPVRNKL